MPWDFRTERAGAWEIPGGIGVLISHNSGQYKEVKAPYVKEDGTYEIKEQVKTVRWYQSINSRFILEDFFAKIEYYFG